MGEPRRNSEQGLSRVQRQIRGRIGGLSMVVTHGADNSNLQAARKGFLARFLRGIDPSLPERERLERAEIAKRMYMTQLSLKSSVARSRRSGQGPRVEGNSPPSDGR